VATKGPPAVLLVSLLSGQKRTAKHTTKTTSNCWLHCKKKQLKLLITLLAEAGQAGKQERRSRKKLEFIMIRIRISAFPNYIHTYTYQLSNQFNDVIYFKHFKNVMVLEV